MTLGERGPNFPNTGDIDMSVHLSDTGFTYQFISIIIIIIIIIIDTIIIIISINSSSNYMCFYYHNYY